jgi:hypothetical protein
VLEILEARRLLYAVNDPGDAPLDPMKGPAETSSGTITLRSAIEQVDIDGHGSITFNGAMTVSVGSQLPSVTAADVTIDGGKIGSVVITGGPLFNGLVIDGGGGVVENLGHKEDRHSAKVHNALRVPLTLGLTLRRNQRATMRSRSASKECGVPGLPWPLKQSGSAEVSGPSGTRRRAV